MAIAAMFVVGCNKPSTDPTPDPTPDPEPKPEYSGPEQGTSQWSVIGSLAEDAVKMNWDADLVMAASGDLFVLKNLKIAAADEFKIRENKDWGNNRGGDFEKLGEGFVVSNGGNNIKPAYAGLVDVWYNPAKEQMAICETGKNPTWKEIEPEPEPEPEAAITIDGDFADWSALEAGSYAKSVSDPNAPWEAVQEIRCYAKDDMVFYYIKYDADYLAELLANPAEILPLRLCINTDGEFTSGYTSYFLEGYDFIVEGDLAKDGAFVAFDGTFFQRIGSWVELAGEGNHLVSGMGAGSEYEIALDRKVFNEFAATSDVPMPMGDTFQTGIRFYFINGNGKWDELSNVPNSDVDEEMGNGYGYLMRVSFK